MLSYCTHDYSGSLLSQLLTQDFASIKKFTKITSFVQNYEAADWTSRKAHIWSSHQKVTWLLPRGLRVWMALSFPQTRCSNPKTEMWADWHTRAGVSRYKLWQVCVLAGYFPG